MVSSRWTSQPTTTTAFSSHEQDNKGTYMGVDDGITLLVDMMNVACLHDLDASFHTYFFSFLNLNLRGYDEHTPLYGFILKGESTDSLGTCLQS